MGSSLNFEMISANAVALVGTFTPIRLYCYTFMLGMATAKSTKYQT
jgi:hypothetical protein